jgi:predicted aldo/keto reductase-like oxidoreductase
VRHIGFTGHKDPRIHAKMLAQAYEWDAVLMPINIMDAHYRSFLNQIVPACRERGIAPLGMKGYGGGWPQARILEKTGLQAAQLLRYNLSQPTVAQIVGITDMEQLKAAVNVARNFEAMPDPEQEALLRRVRNEAGDGRYEAFKSTNEFDGAHHRKQHEFALP